MLLIHRNTITSITKQIPYQFYFKLIVRWYRRWAQFYLQAHKNTIFQYPEFTLFPFMLQTVNTVFSSLCITKMEFAFQSKPISMPSIGSRIREWENDRKKRCVCVWERKIELGSKVEIVFLTGIQIAYLNQYYSISIFTLSACIDPKLIQDVEIQKETVRNRIEMERTNE